MQHNSLDILLSSSEIASRVETLAQSIAQTLPKELLIVGLLRGSFVFTADLMRALHLTAAGMRLQLDFMTLSSYGTGTQSSGAIQIVRDLAEDVAGKDVLIVDDILESGLTLAFARELILRKGAKSAHIAVLLEKPGKRKTDITADFVGFTIPDKFVVGYGLDHANYYRELPYIGVVKTE